jgi:hypothetical protein
MSNIRDDDLPIRGICKRMPEIFRSKDFQELSGRQPEPYKLLLLFIVSDLQVQDLCQKKYGVREAIGAYTCGCLGGEIQGDLLYPDLIRLNNRNPFYWSPPLLHIPLLK